MFDSCDSLGHRDSGDLRFGECCNDFVEGVAHSLDLLITQIMMHGKTEDAIGQPVAGWGMILHEVFKAGLTGE